MKNDVYDLVDAMMRLGWHKLSITKSSLEKLKKMKYINADGRLSKKGDQFLSRWFERGSDRVKLGQELK